MRKSLENMGEYPIFVQKKESNKTNSMVKGANHIELTSLDLARLIQFAAQRFHKVLLNKTQINKILFFVYGVYLADTGKRLFTDDSPKAWPFGPVFPKVYKKADPDEIIKGFSSGVVEAFRSDGKVLDLVANAVNNMHGKSAIELTKWSHKEGSPWYETVYVYDKDGNFKRQMPWNSTIDDDKIKEYFKKAANREWAN